MSYYRIKFNYACTYFFCLIGCGVFTFVFKISGEIFIWHFAGFTGIDDPYEPPLNCEVRVTCKWRYIIHEYFTGLNVHKYAHALEKT